MTAADSFLVLAFFDQPQLLAVRFQHPGGDSRLVHFAATRQPDGGGSGCVGIGATVIIGLVAAGVLSVAVPGCTGGTPQPLAIVDATTRDCSGNGAWMACLSELAAAYAPRREDLQRYEVRTLLDVPREQARKGDATGGWLRPRHGAGDEAARLRGRALAQMLIQAGLGPETAVILDLPGPQSIAAAAGMAIHFDPVICIDNLPHPAGVVPSAQTLAAAVYWQPAFTAARSGRTDRPPAVFVLEGERLAAYRNQADRFDNRSYARLPDIAGWGALGITRLLYVREHSLQGEADDLNALFASCPEHGIEVRHLALDTLGEVPPSGAAGATDGSGTQKPVRLTIGSQGWFWQRYGWGRPADLVLPPVSDADADYRTRLRTTPWSLRTTPLDGGESHHGEIISRLTSPPDSAPSGGSWGRSSSSPWGG